LSIIRTLELAAPAASKFAASCDQSSVYNAAAHHRFCSSPTNSQTGPVEVRHHSQAAGAGWNTLFRGRGPPVSGEASRDWEAGWRASNVTVASVNSIPAWRLRPASSSPWSASHCGFQEPRPGRMPWAPAKWRSVTDPLGAHDYMEQAASGFCVDMVIRTRSASVSGESWRTANSGGASGKPTAGRIAVAIDQSPSSLTFLIIN